MAMFATATDILVGEAVLGARARDLADNGNRGQEAARTSNRCSSSLIRSNGDKISL
jgi:hypothetical protein